MNKRCARVLGFVSGALMPRAAALIPATVKSDVLVLTENGGARAFILTPAGPLRNESGLCPYAMPGPTDVEDCVCASP